MAFLIVYAKILLLVPLKIHGTWLKDYILLVLIFNGMNPEEKQLLQVTYELTEQNNRMLKHIRRSQKIASFMRFIYWIIVVGIAVGSFYFLQPYVDNITKFIKDSGTTFNSIKNVLPK